MGDPYPEDLAQRMLDELVATTRVDLYAIQKARQGWWDAGEALMEIAEQLSGQSLPSSNRKAAWIGSASEAATAAFDELAAEFERHATAMQDLSQTLSGGEADVKQIADLVATQIGTTLKAKPKGGLFGTGIGPSVGPDVVEFVDDVADGVGAVAHNPMAIINKGALLGSPLAALAVAGDNAEKQELSRSDQFKLIQETHDLFSQQMSNHGEAVESTCTSTNAWGDFDTQGESVTFRGDSSGGQLGAGGSASTSTHNFRAASSGGDPRLGPFAAPDRSHATIGDDVPPLSQRITADGGVSGVQSTPGIDLSADRTEAFGSGGAGGSGGSYGAGGAMAGGAAAVAGVGGGLAGALGASRAAAAGGGPGGLLGGALAGGAPGMLGGAPGTGGAGARGAGGGMGMMGQGMGGGGAAGGGRGGGKRYGDGPELGPRDRRRRGSRHAVLGAGSRGSGDRDESAGPEADDPSYDEG